MMDEYVESVARSLADSQWRFYSSLWSISANNDRHMLGESKLFQM
jgi:hypothetical protein